MSDRVPHGSGSIRTGIDDIRIERPLISIYLRPSRVTLPPQAKVGRKLWAHFEVILNEHSGILEPAAILRRNGCRPGFCVAQQEICISDTRGRRQRSNVAAGGVDAGKSQVRAVDTAPGSGIGAEDKHLAAKVEDVASADERHL